MGGCLWGFPQTSAAAPVRTLAQEYLVAVAPLYALRRYPQMSWLLLPWTDVLDDGVGDDPDELHHPRLQVALHIVAELAQMAVVRGGLQLPFNALRALERHGHIRASPRHKGTNTHECGCVGWGDRMPRNTGDPRKHVPSSPRASQGNKTNVAKKAHSIIQRTSHQTRH